MMIPQAGRLAAIGTLLHANLAARHDSIVVETAERAFTGADLLRRSAGVARVLAENGLSRGDRALFFLVGNEDALVCSLACWWLCATPVLMDFRSPAAQRRRIAELLGARLIVEQRRPSGEEQYESLIWNETWCERPAWDAPWPQQDDLDAVPAFMSLSSGTTGLPKAYVHSHQRSTGRVLDRESTGESTGGLIFTPMNLSFAATRNMVMAGLHYGARIRFASPLFSAGELVEMIAASGATACALPPPLIRNLAREVGERSTPFFDRLVMLRSIGGPASAEDKLEAYTRLSRGYVMTYASGLTGTATQLGGPDLLSHTASVGRPLRTVRIEIVDPETLRPLGTGQAGLIRVWTPNLADDVIEAAEGAPNTERWGEGWGIPGDFGRLDAEGYLTIVGREADMIVRGGVNVAPQEIENLLRKDPRIVDVGVVGIDDPAYGQEIAVFIVAESGEEADFHVLCMSLLASDRRPRIIRLVKRLPYNANGKLVRNELRAML
ncbi:acyl-CoA synthetase (AMP-forming)/AMP-acid ligase II [Hoeflea marina]|uniref:Acyl-CoA synthetase (AMP-forming)/AMP-acid ligase II n=1 Tax=Hoeflea marina TaxID=274592 RepID=A0A317PSB0_9HYPH|nr:class I adenylate-forming enzyme family protein [Hoeflea marina]PWW03494.1 acyl-CoA synthetase (AMP-forming)/AMP-acid ligase II [Hoeflea marina]